MKISTLIISLVLISMCVPIVVFYYGAAALDTGVSVNSSSIASFEQFEGLREQASEINTTMRNLNLKNPVQFASSFVSAGFQVLEVTWSSFDIAMGMGSVTIDTILPGEPTGALQVGILLIIIITFIFVIVSTLVGRDV